MKKPRFKTETEAANYLRDAGYSVDEEGKNWLRGSWSAYIQFNRGWYFIEIL